nr:hypothetical protein [Tanacetum cinerariifolium]
MDEDIQEPAIEETQTYYSTKNPTKELIPTEHRSPSLTKDDLESSKSKKFVDASNSESSLCFETFKPFDNYMPNIEIQLEAAASYADLRAVVEGFTTNADNNWNHYNIAINSVMGTIDQINGARIEEKTTFLKALSIVSETLEANIVSTSSSTPAISSDIAELKDMVKALLLDKKNQSPAPTPSTTPAPVKAVEPNCVTYGGAYSYQNCPANHENAYRDNIQ